MKSRMEKYSNLENGNRTERNRSLYKEINKADLSITRSYSNSKVIDEANKEIDIEKIKRYIEKMNDTSNVSRTRIDDIEVSTTLISREEPKKDYDLNSVLEKARSKREVDYEQERSRKVNYSYDDILFQIGKYSNENKILDEEEQLNTEEQTLVNLINTISMNKKESDLFEELKGSENTQILGSINEVSKDENFKDEIKKQLNTDFSMSFSETLESVTKELTEIKEKAEEVLETTKELSKTSDSFYTTGDVFDKKDFQDELTDDEEDEEKVSPLKTIGIIFAVIILIAILVVIANFVFELGLF